MMPPIDPADAPWPDRENLPAKPSASATKQLGGSDLFTPSETTATDQASASASLTADSSAAANTSVPADTPNANDQAGQPADHSSETGDHPPAAASAVIEQAEPPVKQADPEDDSTSESGTAGKRETKPDRRPPVNRSRIIRPASGYSRFSRAIPRQPGPSAHAQDADGAPAGGLDGINGTSPTDPRNYELADDTSFDFGDADRYIPPTLPPMGGFDPVTAGAWIALFGGPAYLLVSMVTDWQIPRWTALVAVIAFIAGFIVLVFRLGDGPSKRDGPDQGAVV